MRRVSAMVITIACSALCLPGLAAQSANGTQQHPRYAQPQQRPAPIVRSAPPTQQPQQQQSTRPQPQQNGGAPLAKIQHHESPNSPAQGEHLAEWMNRHSNMTPQQQQQALANEPGFRDLPAATQQRMRDRIAQLNGMSPQERERILQHNETMEHLTPDQRGQVRGAMTQLSTLPPDRRRFMEKTFRSIRKLPPQQREAYLNSPQVRGQFSPQEFSTLNRLMTVEPLLPRDQ